MSKTGIDQDALIQMFSQATARQGEALRKAVGEATLRALQGRELTLKNIKGVVKTVTEAASVGAAQNPSVDAEALLGKAFAGMDGALLQAVEANRKALEQFVGQGIDLQEKQMKNALSDLEKMEDMFFSTIGKAAESAGAPVQASWSHVLDAMKLKGTAVGGQANATVEQVVAQARDAVRESRALGIKATQALLESYSALVSGVLIGMSEGLQGGAAGEAPAKTSSRARR